MLDVYSVRLDWLSVTFDSAHGTLLVSRLADELRLDAVAGHGLHGMDGLAAYRVPDGQGTVELFKLRDGTQRLHARLSGSITELALEALRKLEPDLEDGRVTRYDVAVDGVCTDEDYHELALALAELADAPLIRSDGIPDRPVSTSVAGDWVKGEKGRTLYVGAPSSSIRARFYEKGIQVGANPDWVRFEWQVRPTATRLREVTVQPPTERYAAFLSRLTGLAVVPAVLRRVDPDTRSGGLRWLEKIAVAMLSKATKDEREQFIRRVASDPDVGIDWAA